MSVEDYTDRLLKKIDANFERCANDLITAARLFDTNRCGRLAGMMDAYTQAANDVKEIRKLYLQFDKQDDTENDASNPLY